MSDELKEGLKEYRGYYAFDPKTFVKYAGPQNMWLQDRELMRKESWSGIRGLFVQDNAVQESMGPIVDRTNEHLGTTDAAIIRARKLYIKAAIALAEEGVEPPGVWEQNDYELIRSDAYVQPVDSLVAGGTSAGRAVRGWGGELTLMDKIPERCYDDA